MALDFAVPWLLQRPGHAICTVSDILDGDELARHPYYLEIMRPEGWRHALAFVVWDRDRIAGFIALNRRAKQGDFTRRERALATLLHPFIVATWERISTNDSTRLGQTQILLTLPLAVVIYSPRMREVLFHNRAALEALAQWRGDSARKRPRKLTARWLPEELVTGCAAVPKGGAEIHSARTGMCARLRRVDPRGHFASNSIVIVLEPAGEHTTRPSARWLRLARDFSLAEQRVATETARGLSNVEIGRVLGKSPATVRKQLQFVFAKANIKTRAELAALYSGFSRPARASKTRAR